LPLLNKKKISIIYSYIGSIYMTVSFTYNGSYILLVQIAIRTIKTYTYLIFRPNLVDSNTKAYYILKMVLIKC